MKKHCSPQLLSSGNIEINLISVETPSYKGRKKKKTAHGEDDEGEGMFFHLPQGFQRFQNESQNCITAYLLIQPGVN